MKLISYLRNDRTLCGILTERGIVNIASAWTGPNPPADIRDILNRGKKCLDTLRELEQKSDMLTLVESVQFLAPIQNPPKILALAGNYSEHIKETGLKLGLSQAGAEKTVPRPFIKPATVVANPGQTITWPRYSKQIDYEIELAAVIGRKAEGLSPEQALDYVTGYTIINDISARSVTFAAGREKRPWDEFFDWLNGKWADSFMPMGPYLVTSDEIAEPQQLKLKTAVNGQIRQDATTAQMIFGVAETISFLSHLMMLEPGDIIPTGTPAGVAMATGDFLEPGDVVRCEIEKIGCLENTIGPRPMNFYEPLANRTG